jgi:hypothetical protein
MNLRMAGTALLGSGLGAAAAHYAPQVLGSVMPAHSQAMTQLDHAANNLGGMRQKYNISAQDLALYEGIRQGLMSGEITGSEVNELAKQGALPESVITLVTDIHDWGRYEPRPWGEGTLAEVVG